MTPDEERQISEAIAGELRLLQPGIRADREQLEALLAEDFVEVGKTGRLWSRAEMIQAMLDDQAEARIETHDVSGQLLAEGVVLVRYRSIAGSAQAWRSSIWTRSTPGWRVSYHQGTLIS